MAAGCTIETKTDVRDPNVITQTVNGNPVLRDKLFSTQFSGGYAIVDRETCTILCQGIRQSWGLVYYPIIFGLDQAKQWIKDGYIGDLQEQFCNLKIFFTNKLIQPPRWRTDSCDPIYRGSSYG